MGKKFITVINRHALQLTGCAFTLIIQELNKKEKGIQDFKPSILHGCINILIMVKTGYNNVKMEGSVKSIKSQLVDLFINKNQEVVCIKL